MQGSKLHQKGGGRSTLRASLDSIVAQDGTACVMHDDTCFGIEQAESSCPARGDVPEAVAEVEAEESLVGTVQYT